MIEPTEHVSPTTRTRRFFTFKRVFYIGLFFKGLDGVIELLTGIALFFVHPDQIKQWVALATRHELAQDPHDFFANLLIKSSNHISHGVTTFLIIYLGIHAGVKLISVLGILLRQLWAYPFALITLSLLTLYQIYDIFIKPSAGIVFLTIIDLIVLWLIFREYRRIRHGDDPAMIMQHHHEHERV